MCERAVVLRITTFPLKVKFLDFYNFNTRKMLVMSEKTSYPLSAFLI